MIIDWGVARGTTPVLESWQIAGLNFRDFGPVVAVAHALASGLACVEISMSKPGILISATKPGVAISMTKPGVSVTMEGC